MSTETTKRIFLAATPDAAWQKKIARSIAQFDLGNMAYTKLIPTNKFHITIHFWAALNANAIKAIIDCTTQVCQCFPAFSVQLTDLILFPSDHKARVIAAKVEAADSLRDFQHALSENYTSQGLPVEQRTFKPHMSLARLFKKTRGTSPLATQAFGVEAFYIDTVTLFESTKNDHGSIYTPLAHFTLPTDPSIQPKMN